MNKFNRSVATSTAVILLSACGNDYSNVASYTVEKQECMQPFKCSFVIRLENKLSEQDLTLMSNKIRDDAPTVDNLFINYYLPCMEVGNGAWAAARFTPEFSLNIQDYMLENNPACKTKLYDLRKKYPDELAAMHLIIESMDDDLKQMIMAKKD